MQIRMFALLTIGKKGCVLALKLDHIQKSMISNSGDMINLYAHSHAQESN